MTIVREKKSLTAIIEAVKLMRELAEKEKFPQHLFLSSLVGIFAVTPVV